MIYIFIVILIYHSLITTCNNINPSIYFNIYRKNDVYIIYIILYFIYPISSYIIYIIYVSNYI